MILPSASPVSWLLALAAAAAYASSAAASSRLSTAAARNVLLLAWVLHAAVLAWGLWGDTPRFGFAHALSMTAWLVLTVYAIERQLFPQLQARWVLAVLGAGPVLLALVFPGQALHGTASAWLPLHLALGIACYGLFAAAVVHAWLMTRAEHHIRQAEDPHSGMPAAHAGAPDLPLRHRWFRAADGHAGSLAGCSAKRCTAAPGAGTTRRCSRCCRG